MENDIMGDQLKNLFNAIESLGSSKKNNDTIKFEMESVHKRITQMSDEMRLQNNELQTVSITIIP